MLFGYERGATTTLESSVLTDNPTEATIYGTVGTIRLHSRFHHTQKISLVQQDETKDFEIPYRGNGYLHEIEEVNHCLLEGKTESLKLPLSMSLDLISVIDRVKKEIGLSY